MVPKRQLTNIQRRGAVAQKKGKPKCMASRGLKIGKRNFQVGKDLQGYCRGENPLTFFLEFACSGKSHGEPTLTH